MKPRPHAKSHKTPIVARRQLASGAIGITCAIQEGAEATVTGGAQNILIANQIIGRYKSARLMSLARRANLVVAVALKTRAAYRARSRTAVCWRDELRGTFGLCAKSCRPRAAISSRHAGPLKTVSLLETRDCTRILSAQEGQARPSPPARFHVSPQSRLPRTPLWMADIKQSRA